MLKLASLWTKTSKKGTKYLTGTLYKGHDGRMVNIMILPNTTKQSEKSPTHHVFLSEVLPEKQAWQKKPETKERKPFIPKAKNENVKTRKPAAPAQAEAFDQHPTDAPHPVDSFESFEPDMEEPPFL